LLQISGVTTNAVVSAKHLEFKRIIKLKPFFYRLVGYSKDQNFAQVDDSRSKPFVQGQQIKALVCKVEHHLRY
jgi:hypothetical protein